MRSLIHDKMVLYCLLLSINPLASTVFFNGQLTDLASVHNQLASARHTPVHKEVHFRAASDHQAQQLSRHPSFSQPQPQATTSRSAENTPSYDMESWFSTFPATTSTSNTVQPAATSSTFTPFHVSLLSDSCLISRLKFLSWHPITMVRFSRLQHVRYDISHKQSFAYSSVMHVHQCTLTKVRWITQVFSTDFLRRVRCIC